MKRGKTSLVDVSIMFVFFTTPLESVAILENFSLTKLSVLLLVIAVLCSFPKVISWKLDKVIGCYAIFCFYVICSALWGVDIENSLNRLMSFLLPTIFVCFIISNVITSKVQLQQILISYVLGCCVTCYFALNSRKEMLMEALYGDQERLTALGQDQNAYAFLLTMGIVMLLHGLHLCRSKWQKCLSVLLVILFVFIVLSTGSRMGFILLLLVFLLFVWANKRYIFISIPLMLVAMILLLPYIPDSIFERFANIGSEINSGDFSDRGYVWKRGWDAFTQENVLFGVGYANFGQLLKMYYGGWSMASHNTYLTYLVEFGFIGFWVFGGLLWMIFRVCCNIYKHSKSLYVFAYYIPIIVTMLVLETEYKRWIFFIGILLYKAEILYQESLINKRK